MAAKGISNSRTPYKCTQGQTSRIVNSGKTGAAPRVVPKPDAASLRRVAEGSIGRDLAPTTGRKTGLPADLTPAAVQARKEGQSQ
ncbi:hypothetical protein WOC76_04325 [Methylocystis sp. IM3]|uniref:hypothetical protein n=1 Tax=unclassified Methylocystis TaxID=2625913 RepID=UPI0030FB6AA6